MKKELELQENIQNLTLKLREVSYNRGFKEGATTKVESKEKLLYQDFNAWTNRCEQLLGWNPTLIKQNFLEKGYLIKKNNSYTIEEDSTYFIKREGVVYISTILTGIYESAYFTKKARFLGIEEKMEREIENLEANNTIYKISLVEKKERCELFKEHRESLVDKHVK